MKIGILGAGGIAGTMATTLNRMKKAMQGTPDRPGICDVELYAVGSRTLDKAKQFAEKFGVQKAFGSYEEMLSDPEVELVYVATPHSHHYENMLACIEHKKHVLCEKAFTANAGQAAEVFEKAAAQGVMVTEAIWTRYQPMRKIISDTVASGIIGKAWKITANLDYVVGHLERMRQPSLAGGALLDVGVYPINFAEMIFGRPDDVFGVCVKMDTNVDAQNSITMTWKDGRMAVLTSGIYALSDRQGIIYGTKGFIVVENVNNPQKLTVYDLSYKPVQEIACPPQLTGYEYEVAEACEVIRCGRTECPSMPHEETIHVMQLMDRLREQFGVKYPFEH